MNPLNSDDNNNIFGKNIEKLSDLDKKAVILGILVQQKGLHIVFDSIDRTKLTGQELSVRDFKDADTALLNLFKEHPPEVVHALLLTMCKGLYLVPALQRVMMLFLTTPVSPEQMRKTLDEKTEQGIKEIEAMLKD